MKPPAGKSLAEGAKTETLTDLISEDESRIGAMYFLMSEENSKKEIATSWISLGLDKTSQAPKDAFLKSNPYPRAYGTFAQVLGRYVREEKALTLPEAIRRPSALPVTDLGLVHRGFLRERMFADMIVFDPATITDHATFENMRQYATGILSRHSG